MDSAAAACATRAEVPFAPLLAGLALWTVLKLVLEAFLQSANPEFLEDLKLDLRKRYDVYFGMCLGTFFKVISITSCTLAVLTTSAETDIIGFARPLNTAEQWCWGCRAIIYIQELPHLTSIPELTIHHLLSVAGMIGVLQYNIPRRQMYLMWATLVSEFVGNSRLILRFHGRLTARMHWWFSLAMAMTILGFRVTGCFVAMVWVMGGGASGVALFVNAGGLTIYTLYMLIMTWRELDRAKIVVIDKSYPARFIIADRWRVNLYGLVIGLAFMCTEVSALLIYEGNGGRLNSQAELHDLAWAALQAVVAGLLGAYATAPIVRLTSPKRVQGLRERRGGPRLWLQGGCLSAAAALLFSPTIASSIDREAFLGCMALSFPFLNAIRYVGYHYTGIGPSTTKQRPPFALPPSPPTSPPTSPSLMEKPNKDTQDPPKVTRSASPPPSTTVLPLPLAASFSSAALYCSLLTAHLWARVDLGHAVCVALAVQGAIHLEVENRRGDASKEEAMWTKIHLAAQIVATVGYLEYATVIASPSYILAPNALLVASAVSVSWAMEALSRPAPRGRRHGAVSEKTGEKEGKPHKGGNSGKIAAVVATIVLVLMLILGNHFGAMPSEVTSVEEARKGAGQPGPGWGVLSAAWSWQFALSTLGVAVLPVVVVQAAA